ncbi:MULTISPECIES: YicC/YloC family endoribonuclease [unclassified Ruegeria]|uniref:YicC/YloC family endoribonuclease n=1 Tax=unclassified Ruegeria TaxID=2625375 RepID=UPI001488A7EC|nr:MULTISPECIES: YicC/YloC family endoribonuclease [unclassified Ruegeria]NOD46237.1 YicC family protein [Ruegeria sp. HKCCD5849]NOD50463.1 YicC family protein [Ruegeria sp. HKCCD5851]NOD67279.1 YicC family protein [Ruegeria sp. HKCCD7303]NOE32867.1 YicC family protein [Ruegeria sp. HKCCD7318]
MIRSMTGFASAQGQHGPHSWTWELRSVNGKGLDMRLRVPDWLTGLEAALRAKLSKSLSRGNVTLSMRLNREDSAPELALNETAMNAALTALEQAEQMASARGITLAPSRASDLLALKGMLDAGSDSDDPGPLVAHLTAEFDALVDAFLDMRRTEGAALAAVLNTQLDQVATLTAKAAELAEHRRDNMAQALRENLARVLDNSQGADPERVAQELALIAVKADITEEIDRLTAHVKAARDLLGKNSAVGRKLDFLMQEFNREANTLCSKAQSSDLTAVGLELKAVIDQMREQVQNVE